MKPSLLESVMLPSKVLKQKLEGKISAAQVKRKWENLKQKYKDLKCPQNGVSTEDGEVTAASWKWYSVSDEALGSRPSITHHPTLLPQETEELILEMEEREAEREMEAVEREERRWREMMEREERRERERREREAKDREERRDREMREREREREREGERERRERGKTRQRRERRDFFSY